MKKVVVLIDGQNLFYNLKEMRIKEKDINWTKFFEGILENEEELIRAYWFRPQKILDSYFTNPNIKYQIVKKHFEHCLSYFPNSIESIPEPDKTNINKMVSSVEEWLRDEKRKFFTNRI